MIIIKNTQELAAMRISAKKTATILHKVAAKVAPGVTTKELDDYASELARKEDGRCAFYGYHGFSGHICSSVNEEVVHGVPGRRVIKDGDVVSIDFGLVYGGFVGDTATTVAVGEIDPEWRRLLDATRGVACREERQLDALQVQRHGLERSEQTVLVVLERSSVDAGQGQAAGQQGVEAGRVGLESGPEAQQGNVRDA